MARKRTFAMGLGASLALAFLSSQSWSQEKAPETPANALPSIVVTRSAQKAIVERVVVTGTIDAMEETYVSPLIDGLSIRTLNVDIGDRVEAGGTLAVLNDDMLLLQKSQYQASLAKVKASLAQYQAQLAEAQVNAEEAVRVSDRSKKLAASGSMSTAQADQERAAATAALARVTSAEQQISVAKADITVAESQILDVDLRLERTEVKAPVGGVISAKTAKVGAIATGASDPLFTIIRDGILEMKADVPEADILLLAKGQKAFVTLAGGKTVLGGTVRLISPMVDGQTRLGTVYVRLTDPQKARAGMYAGAQIIVEEKHAIVLPLTAVTTVRNEATVRKVENGIVQLVTVETGIQDGKFIEITKGLEDGDQVVAKAGAYVRDGDRINPVEEPAAKTN